MLEAARRSRWLAATLTDREPSQPSSRQAIAPRPRGTVTIRSDRGTVVPEKRDPVLSVGHPQNCGRGALSAESELRWHGLRGEEPCGGPPRQDSMDRLLNRRENCRGKYPLLLSIAGHLTTCASVAGAPQRPCGTAVCPAPRAGRPRQQQALVMPWLASGGPCAR